jgi:hypothetical protein
MTVINRLTLLFSRPLVAEASYGYTSFTHLTTQAEKIKTRALRIFSVFLAALFDATIGLGIVKTFCYNSFAFLYNQTYVRRKNHSIKKENLLSLELWKARAVKITATLFGLSLLSLGLFLLRWKQQTPPPPSEGSSWLSFALPIITTLATTFFIQQITSIGSSSVLRKAAYFGCRNALERVYFKTRSLWRKIFSPPQTRATPSGKYFSKNQIPDLRSCKTKKELMKALAPGLQPCDPKNGYWICFEIDTITPSDQEDPSIKEFKEQLSDCLSSVAPEHPREKDLFTIEDYTNRLHKIRLKFPAE